MVYIRSKNVKGIEYAYLVRSEWDSGRGTSRQRTIKYLGRSSEVKLDDIPEQYRADPKITSFISGRSSSGGGSEGGTSNNSSVKVIINALQDELLGLLAAGDSAGAVALYEKQGEALGLAEFYDRVLTPVMYRIGTMWERGEMDIATEHVCTNVAHALVQAINAGGGSSRVSARSAAASGKKVLICTPEGELHGLTAAVIESVLKSKGYMVCNAAPSAPADSVARLIEERDPDLVMVSVTLPENAGAAERLARRVAEFGRPVLVGGLAATKVRKDGVAGAAVVTERSAEEVLKAVRAAMMIGKRDSKGM